MGGRWKTWSVDSDPKSFPGRPSNRIRTPSPASRATADAVQASCWAASRACAGVRPLTSVSAAGRFTSTSEVPTSVILRNPFVSRSQGEKSSGRSGEPGSTAWPSACHIAWYRGVQTGSLTFIGHRGMWESRNSR